MKITVCFSVLKNIHEKLTELFRSYLYIFPNNEIR